MEIIYKSPIYIICLIIFIISRIFPPKNINDFYGYRTSNSKKNKSNWDFAQKYSTTLIIILLFILLGFQVVLYNIDPNYPYFDFMSLIGLFVVIGIVFYKTERKLKRMPS
ncbi:SdpI family protein [Flavobacterium artemisiae]|uniref:SdpI family protein n=1 Tax=Flavobacterium artemisiae TaxID=2126556 RepID=A0ABW4H6Y6_9FLAO